MNEQAEENYSDELKGLPAAIQKTFKDHPTWKTIETDIIVCAGPECVWRKPAGRGIKQAWLKHQTYTMQMAVADWYFGEDRD